MQLEAHDDRFAHEGDHRVDQATRDEYERMAKAVDDARAELRAAAYAAGHKVALANKRFIDTFNRNTPNHPMETDEAIAGMVECIDDCFGDLLDGSEVCRAKHIAETGEDL